MQFTDYTRVPFTVQATEITAENLDDVVDLLEGTVHKTNKGVTYIRSSKIDAKIPRVYLGFWITVLDGAVHCFPPRTFERMFVKTTDQIQDWVDYMNSL